VFKFQNTSNDAYVRLPVSMREIQNAQILHPQYAVGLYAYNGLL